MSYKIETLVCNIHKNAEEFQSCTVDVHFNSVYHVDCEVTLPLVFIPEDLATDLRVALDSCGIDKAIYEFSYCLVSNMNEFYVTQGNRTFKRIEYA